MLRAFARTLLVLLTSATGAIAAEDKPSRSELEKRFETTMSGAVMEGHFTLDGDEQQVSPKAEKYSLKKVKKLEAENTWLFEVRIQYGEHDRTLPLALTVLWAGDTPVITLDKVLVPGFGTFSARVLIYDNQYAGTWSGGDHGGQLFGHIRPAANKEAEEKAK